MRRREFGTLLGVMAAITLPSRVGAQQKAMPVIGFLGAGAPGTSASQVAGFRQGLKETGYIEGQNLTIEYCWAEGLL